jgi:hypothetical protein
VVVDADLPKFVDDDSDTVAVVGGEDAIEQGRLSRPEEAGQDDDGSFLGSFAIEHLMDVG